VAGRYDGGISDDDGMGGILIDYCFSVGPSLTAAVSGEVYERKYREDPIREIRLDLYHYVH
jgi:hypothetical protein